MEVVILERIKLVCLLKGDLSFIAITYKAKILCQNALVLYWKFLKRSYN